MPCKRKIYRCGKTIHVEETQSRIHKPGEHREKRRKPTKEEMMLANERERARKLCRKIEYNFGEGDYHTTLTYKKYDRPDPTEAKKRINKLIAKLRKAYKKLGYQLKYIVVTEYLNHAIHHHLIINNIVSGQVTTAVLIQQYWDSGRSHFTPLDASGDYRQLAEYLVKETVKTLRNEDSKYHQCYSCSRNLIDPEPEVHRMRAKEFQEPPKPEPGYYIDMDNIIDHITQAGYRYRYYRMIKIDNINDRRTKANDNCG